MKLDVQNISISLGAKPKKRILENVSFSVADGELLSLLGASGAGKSTLLKIIAGILIQDEGSIIFEGASIDGLPAHKRRVGFVFQDMRLFPNMNVEENIAFPCKMARMPKKERLEHARELLEHVQLSGFGKRDVASLSGGQQQRVALARALAAQPHVLLLDEPFSGLDENLRDEMRSLVLHLQRSFGITTVMVTHDAVEALEMSQHVVYLNNGKVLQDDKPRMLFSEPASPEIAACFGECSVLDGQVEAGVFKRGAFTLAAPECPSGAAQAVIRYGDVLLPQHTEQPAQTAASSSACELVVRCSVYRGDSYLIRLDVDGQVLTALSETPYEPGQLLAVKLAPGRGHVYTSKSEETE